ncbi:TraR/DksA family transcriptional regulator [Streptomyces sp. NPDC003877]
MNQQAVGRSAPHLSAEDLAVLRENLHEQRLFRREQLRRLAEPVASRARELRGQAASAHLEVGVKLAASARMVLADVEAALARMDAGGYGICGRCRRPVDRERLLIVPQARYCGRCGGTGDTAR